MKKNRDFITLFIGSILNGTQSLVKSVFDSLQQATDLFTRNLARRAALYFFIFLGSIFILTGLARFLSLEYGFPGSGEMVVGVGILVLSFVIYALTKDDS